MESQCVLLLALAVGACAAVPVSWRVESSTSCARQCTASSKFNYEPRTTYEFDYDVHTRTAMAGATSDHASVDIHARVHIEVLSKCDLVLRLSDVTIKATDPDNPDSMTYADPMGDFRRKLEEFPLRFSWQDGLVEELCPDEDEDRWALNIKRGILSAFHNGMQDLDRDERVHETDVTGNCAADYLVTQRGQFSSTVTRTKNLLACTDRHGYRSVFQATPYAVDSSLQSLPVTKSSHECSQEISSKGLLQRVRCHEVHVIRPFSKDSNGAMTESTQSLEFRRETSYTSSRRGEIRRRTDISYEHANSQGDADTLESDATSTLRQLCSAAVDDVRPNVPQLFTQLVYTLRNMDTPGLRRLHRETQRNYMCEKARKFVQDAIPMLGTAGAVAIMQELLTDKSVTGNEANLWLTSLPFIQRPTDEMLQAVEPLLKNSDLSIKAMLPVSGMVNNYCRRNAQCAQEAGVQAVVEALEENLGTCDVTDATRDKILMTLRAIGNAGRVERLALRLDRCLDRGQPTEVRVAATQAFRRLPCSADRNNVLEMFRRSSEDSEVRIAAYLAAMECPSEEVLRQVKDTLSGEEVNQVGSFVWTHLSNLLETQSPLKQALRQVLEDQDLIREFSKDARKFSRNVEVSGFLEKYNLGATAESNLIWSPTSFIPRSASLNLTLDIFGSSINLFEVGGRVEGLEYVLEKYFGPEGYFKDGEAQAKPDYKNNRVVKLDKMRRIKKAYGDVKDNFQGSMYVRLFGNELAYKRFQQLSDFLPFGSGSKLTLNQYLDKLRQPQEHSFTQNAMFWDSTVVIPTSAGLPLSLALNGTISTGLTASGRLDLANLGKSPKSLLIEGELKPSAAVELSGVMSLDAFVTRAGLKMVFTAHTSSAVKGKMELAGGQIFSLELDSPREKIEIFDVSTKFFLLHAEREREQPLVVENRRTKSACTGTKLEQITGLQLCGEISFPNASMLPDAPFFPFTGPVTASLTLHKKDAQFGYRMQAKNIRTPSTYLGQIGFDTPGSREDRALSLDVMTGLTDKTLEVNLLSPWKKANFKGSMVNETDDKQLSGTLVLDNKDTYSLTTAVGIETKGKVVTYKPTMTFSRPGVDPVVLEGSVQTKKMEKIEDLEAIEGEVKIKGVHKHPVELGGSLVWDSKERGISGKFSMEPKKDYTIKARLQTSANKKETKFTPLVMVHTPESTLLSFKGTGDYRPGKSLKGDLQLDMEKVFEKSITLKGAVNSVDNDKRKRIRGNVNFVSSFLSAKFNGNMDTKKRDGKDGPVSTRFTLDYLIPKSKKNVITFSSKFINKTTDSLMKYLMNANLNVKNNPDYNVLLDADMEHKAVHSNANIRLRHGKNVKKAEDKTHELSISTTVNHKIKDDVATMSYNFETVYPHMDVEYQVKGDHRHDPKMIMSTMTVIYGPKKAASVEFLKNDESTKKLTHVTSSFSVSYPGREARVSTSLEQKKEQEDYLFTVNVSPQRGEKYSVATNYRKPSSSEIQLASEANLHGWDPISLTASTKLDREDFQGDALLTFNRTQTYGVGMMYRLSGDFLRGQANLTLPERRVTLLGEGGRRGSRHSGKAQVMWDALNDPSQILEAEMGYEHRKGWKSEAVSGNLKLLTPFEELPEFSVDLGYEDTPSKLQANSAVVYGSKDQKIDAKLEMKKPATAESFMMQFGLTTPFNDLTKMGLEVEHNYKDELNSKVKGEWNKEEMAVELHAHSRLANESRDIEGSLVFTSTLADFGKRAVRLSHKDTGKKITQTAFTEFWQRQYAYNLDIDYDVVGWQLNTRGDASLRAPELNYALRWSHVNQPHLLNSDVTLDLGNNQRYYVKVEGSDNPGIRIRQVRGSFNLQTPHEEVRELEANFDQEFGTGHLTTKSIFKQDRRTKASLDMNYRRSPGIADWDFSMVTPFTDDIKSKINARYAVPPFTAHAEAEWSGKSRVSVDALLTGLSADLLNGNVRLATSFPEASSAALEFSHKKLGSQYDTSASLEYQPGKKLEATSTLNVGSLKKMRVQITTPFQEMTNFDAGAELRLDPEEFRAAVFVELLPVMEKFSAEVSRDVQKDRSTEYNARLVTPFPEFRYGKAHASSVALATGRRCMMEVEYPEKQVLRFETTHAIADNDISVSMELMTPYSQMPRMAGTLSYKNMTSHLEGQVSLETPFQGYKNIGATFRHQQGETKLASSGSVTYSGTTIDGDLDVQWTGPVEATLKVKTPFEEVGTIRATVSHQGTPVNFKSHGEVTYAGQLIKSDLTFQHDSSTELTFGLQTPYQDFRNVKLDFTRQGPLEDFMATGTLDLGSGKTFESRLQHQSSDRKFFVSTTLKSPYTEDISATVDFDGKLKTFTCKVSANIGNAYALNTSTDFKLRKELLDLDIKGDYTFQGAKKPASLMVKHRGDIENFNTEVTATHATEHYSANVHYNKAKAGVMAGFDLSTPYPDYSDIGASFDHTGNSEKFTTSGLVKWGKGEEARGKVVWERTEWKRINLEAEGSCTESTRSAKLSALIDTLGDQYTMNGNLDLGPDMMYELTSSLTMRQPLAMHVNVRTPHEGFKRLEFLLNHAGPWQDFRTNARFSSDQTKDIVSVINFRYADPKDVDLEASLTSEIKHIRYILVTYKVFVKMGEKVSKYVIAWDHDKRITSTTAAKVHGTSDPLVQDVSYSYSFTSPFDSMRELGYHFEHNLNGQRLAQKAKVTHNEKTWLDADYEVQYGENKAASLSVREPHPMMLSLTTAFRPPSLFETDVFLNWNSTDRDANIRFQGRLANQGDERSLDTDFKVKVIHPSRTLGVESSVKASDAQTYSRGLLTWDENAGSTFSYEVDMSRRDTRLMVEQSGVIKLGVPMRSVKFTGSRTSSDRDEGMEAAFYWDADRDDSKHVAVKANKGQRGKANATSLQLLLPSIRKEYKVENEMTWDAGSMVMDGTTKLSYSSDPQRTLILTHRVDDLSSIPGSSNYSLALGVMHPATDVNIQFVGHRGKSTEKCSVGARLMYQTAHKQKKNFAARLEIDYLKRQMDWQMVSPLKTVQILGQLEGGTPYHLKLTNTYDGSRVVTTDVTLDTRKRSLEAEMHYNADKPEDSLHFSARYLNDSAIMAEIYREHDFRRVSDAMLRMRLNSSHILHTRVTWRPELLQELQILMGESMQRTAAQLNAVVMASSQALGEELQAKYVALSGELRSEMAPLVLLLEKELSSVKNDLSSAHRELYRFYSRNSQGIREISDLFEKAFNSFFSAFSGLNQQYATWYVETERAMEGWLRELQAFPIQQAFSQAIMETMADIQQFRGIMGMQVMRLFTEIDKMLDETYRLYLTFTRSLQRQLNGLLDDLTSDPNLAFLKERYLEARAKLQSLPDLDYAALSELLSLKMEETLGRLGLLPAFNQMRDNVQTQLEALKQRPGFQQLHDAANEVYQQAVWAFTYWKVDESFRLALNKAYLVFKDLALAELSQIRGNLVAFDKSRLIVIDPRIGELQFELFLPIPLESLANMPHHGLRQNIVRFKNFVNSYLPPRNFSLWDPYYSYKPSCDFSNWVPPFETRGWLLNDQHFVTFDGRHMEFAGDCSYVLVKDMVHDRFTVVVNYDEGAQTRVQSLLVMLPDLNLEIFPDFKVKVNERDAELPIYTDDVTAVRDIGGISVTTAFGVDVYAVPQVKLYEVALSGWHHGRVAGMLGVPDNEPYNDMTAASRAMARDVTDMANSWEVGRGSCRTRTNEARELGPADAKKAQDDCKAYFEDNDSIFRACFGQVSPKPFLQLCMQQAADSSVEAGVCRTAAQYNLVCESMDVTLPKPSSCARCDDVDTKRRDFSDVKMADVVLMVEEKQCNKWARRHLPDIVNNIEQAYRKRGMQDVRFGLVSYGGDGDRYDPHVNTIDGQHFGSAQSFLKAVQSLTFSNSALPADPLFALDAVRQYSFRTGVVKALVLAPCTPCGTGMMSIVSLAEYMGFNVHTLHGQTLMINHPERKDAVIFGVDSHSVYTMDDNPDRNQELLDAMKWPADSCSEVVASTKGAIFDVSHLEDKHARVQKEFIKALSSRVAQSTQPPCQECRCEGDAAFSRTVCTPCSAANSWWNEIKEWFHNMEEAARAEEKGQEIANTLSAKAA